ncbi:bacterial group 3 Ig-like protein [Acinetobacter sp. WC-743]|uniref:Ig-like domain-containing protein n=1 Tax=Acinetobacter sp. WC-743 TaxID=903945 RepID=UPI0002AE86EF|nr:Ig-like domain-containing protein [Acinetobacter sp. WC-743]ELW85597.1 bacterial group 3 Ig-like protein [Acinetobacter sp. WC-743]
MLNIQIVSKETHQVLDLKGSTDVKLVENSVVIINVKKEDIASTERVGNALVILLKSGEKISIENFFASHSDNDIVLKDDQNKLFLLELNQTQDVLETVNYISINDIEPLLYHDANIEILPWVIGGALGIGAIAAIANNDSSSDKKNGDVTPPNQPLVHSTNGRLITGTAEAGSTVNITDSSGKVIGTTTAGPDGKFTFTPTTPIPDGTTLKVTAVDASGNVSPPAQVIVDSTAPAQPIVDPTDGSPITGTAEAGSTVNITDSSGKVIGTTTAGPDGKFTFTPTTSIPDGTALKVTAVDASGNVSPPAVVIVDSTAPTVIISMSDTILTIGESALVTFSFSEIVKNFGNDDILVSNGTLSPVSSNDGGLTWTAIFTPNANFLASNNKISVIAGSFTDITGNVGIGGVGPNFAINTTTASAAPVVNVTGNPDGSVSVSGTAEPNSNIEIRYPDGSTVTTPVDSSGNYGPVTSAINQPTGTVSGTVTDASSNTGPSTSTNYVDNIDPAAPVVNVTSNPDGSVSVSGTAEPNSNIEIRYPDGSTVTTRWTVPVITDR